MDESCAIPVPMDMDELIVKSSIKRMLSDNYTLLFVFLFVIVILVLILLYFFKQIKLTLDNYKKYIGQNETISTNDDNEVQYTDEDTSVMDVSKYQDSNKTAFYKSVKDLYNEYNTEKTNYIKTTYGKENDDYIDENMSYKAYDDYMYKLQNN